MFAIFVTGGKQYKVSVGEFVQIEKINANVGDTVTFDVIALQTAEGFKVGTPVVEGAKVTATVTEVGKDKKIYVMKYKAKKNEKKKIGHRQPFTKVEITAIEG